MSEEYLQELIVGQRELIVAQREFVVAQREIIAGQQALANLVSACFIVLCVALGAYLAYVVLRFLLRGW